MQDLALLANSSTGNTESGKFWHFSLAILVRLTGQECSKPGNKNQSSHRAGLKGYNCAASHLENHLRSRRELWRVQRKHGLWLGI